MKKILDIFFVSSSVLNKTVKLICNIFTPYKSESKDIRAGREIAPPSPPDCLLFAPNSQCMCVITISAASPIWKTFSARCKLCEWVLCVDIGPSIPTWKKSTRTAPLSAGRDLMFICALASLFAALHKDPLLVCVLSLSANWFTTFCS